MTKQHVLSVQFFLGLFGCCFSGWLSYQELFGFQAMSCPSPGAPGTIFGYPACVYGFFVFVILTGFAGYGLRLKK